MSAWTLCLLVALAVAVAPASSWSEAAAASPAQQAVAAEPAAAAAAAAAAVNVDDWLLCPGCGPYSSLVNAVLRAVYNLLFALLGNVNVALCYTLYLVYILLCIIQVTVSNVISIAVSALYLILQRLLGLPELGGLLRSIGLLLIGLLGCLLRVLGATMPV